MFNSPFSFNGRIRRTEYGISCIITFVFAIIIAIIGRPNNINSSLVYIFYIPLIWFFWAQSAKRCHDIDKNGWWQCIPFYFFILLFKDGVYGMNQYGANPKNIQMHQNLVANAFQQGTQTGNTTSTDSATGYHGGYSGGHNNPNSNPVSKLQKPNNSDTDGYKSGNLYK